jgi:hypothetical protein
MVVRILFIFVLCFVAFRLVIPYMISSQSTELVIVGSLAFIGIIGFYLHKVEKISVESFKKYFNKKGE